MLETLDSSEMMNGVLSSKPQLAADPWMLFSGTNQPIIPYTSVTSNSLQQLHSPFPNSPTFHHDGFLFTGLT